MLKGDSLKGKTKTLTEENEKYYSNQRVKNERIHPYCDLKRKH